MYTPFAHAFAYAINKTPYVVLYWFSVKITLCMLYSVAQPRPSMSELVGMQSELVGILNFRIGVSSTCKCCCPILQQEVTEAGCRVKV